MFSFYRFMEQLDTLLSLPSPIQAQEKPKRKRTKKAKLKKMSRRGILMRMHFGKKRQMIGKSK